MSKRAWMIAILSLVSAASGCTVVFGTRSKTQTHLESTRLDSQIKAEDRGRVITGPTLEVNHLDVRDGALRGRVEDVATCGDLRTTRYRDVYAEQTRVHFAGEPWTYLEAAGYDAGSALLMPVAMAVNWGIFTAGTWDASSFEGAMIIGGALAAGYLVSAVVNLAWFAADEGRTVERTRVERTSVGSSVECQRESYSGDVIIKLGPDSVATTIVDGLLDVPDLPGAGATLLDHYVPLTLSARYRAPVPIPLDEAQRIALAAGRMGPIEPRRLFGRAVVWVPVSGAPGSDFDAAFLEQVDRRVRVRLPRLQVRLKTEDEAAAGPGHIRLAITLSRPEPGRCQATINATHSVGSLPFEPVVLKVYCRVPSGAIRDWLSP